MKTLNNDEIVKAFEDLGYNDVEIIGDRLLFSTGEEIYNWGLEYAKSYITNLLLLKQE